MTYTLYRETEWFEFVDCQKLHDKPRCEKDGCDECMELYMDLVSDASDEMDAVWNGKGYSVWDIWESDFEDNGWYKVKFCAVLKKDD